MINPSILFPTEKPVTLTDEQPAYFSDLNLDQVVAAITAGKKDYNLNSFFYTTLADLRIIHYRQDVFRDLEEPQLITSLKSFAEGMVLVRRYLGLIEKLDFNYHKKGWFLEAALQYCQTVSHLENALSQFTLKSDGFVAFQKYLADYVHAPAFQNLYQEAQKVKQGLEQIRYCIILQAGSVRVRNYEGEIDYSQEILKAFEKFKQGAVKDYRVELRETSGMNHVEAKILEFVARLNPQEFNALDRFCDQHPIFIDQTIQVFDREIQFYIAYLDFIVEIKKGGYSFCLPNISTTKDIYAKDAFDLALANSYLYQDKRLICNDFELKGDERIIMITGPNQGGKTTFARMFGQLHHLASIGCPIPGKDAQLFLFDHIYTHFEREEEVRNLRGKLQDDLVRIHTIMERATPASIFVLNEIFSSTTLKDAIFLSHEILKHISNLDALCVWVTFLDELSTFNEKVVSMVSTVSPQNPLERTFKIIRKPADGLAYALSLAEKHRLTYQQILERIQP
ncbi:MAG: MutS-related protein [Anaerolineales bacterium]